MYYSCQEKPVSNPVCTFLSMNAFMKKYSADYIHSWEGYHFKTRKLNVPAGVLFGDPISKKEYEKFTVSFHLPSMS